MKLLLVLTVLLVQGSAFADKGFNLAATSPLKATSYEVENTSINCPPGATCHSRSILVLNYTLQGCMDDLAVQYKTEQTADGKLRVLVSATNLHNEDSAKVLCKQLPLAQATVTLGRGGLGQKNLEVVELEGEATPVRK